MPFLLKDPVIEFRFWFGKSEAFRVEDNPGILIVCDTVYEQIVISGVNPVMRGKPLGLIKQRFSVFDIPANPHVWNSC